MAKRIFILTLLFMIFWGLPYKENIAQEGLAINEIPMYGDPEKSSFIQNKIKEGDNSEATLEKLKNASKQAAQFGWDYFKKNDVSTAMKRFNQAWLIDHDNFQAYWGFAEILIGRDNNLLEANKFYGQAISLLNKKMLRLKFIWIMAEIA